MAKAQTSFLMQGIYLILVLIVIALVLNEITNMNIFQTGSQENVEVKKIANDALEMMIVSDNCLGYKEKGEVEGKEVTLDNHHAIDLNKLESFSSSYANIEPGCVRNYKYRFEFEFETSNLTKDGFSDSPEKWHIGVSNHSEGKALKMAVSLSTPVGIRISDTTTQPATATITVYNGDLEQFSGLIDSTCFTGVKTTSQMIINYPTYTKSGVKNYLCMNYQKGEFCVALACEKKITLLNLNAGSYDITLTPEKDQLIIGV